MKSIFQFLLIGILFASLGSAFSGEPLSPDVAVRDALKGKHGTLVIIDCRTMAVIDAFPEESAKRRPPCSTFKIWNTLAGLENGLISSRDEPFYKWDGTARSIPEWNRNLTLKVAFQVSCVPAFQGLARRIGGDGMASWINTLKYGNGDISSGLDVFWLPAEGRRTILISPAEQAELIRKLVKGKLPVSERSRSVLRDLMLARKTDKGTLYGKTGTGQIDKTTNVGWYVGYAETGTSCLPFACALFGEGVMGKDARAVVENAFEMLGFL